MTGFCSPGPYSVVRSRAGRIRIAFSSNAHWKSGRTIRRWPMMAAESGASRRPQTRTYPRLTFSPVVLFSASALDYRQLHAYEDSETCVRRCPAILSPIPTWISDAEQQCFSFTSACCGPSLVLLAKIEFAHSAHLPRHPLHLPPGLLLVRWAPNLKILVLSRSLSLRPVAI